MRERNADSSRRRFIFLAIGGAVAAPIAGLLGVRPAVAAKPKLDPTSERAQELAYTHDAAATDHPDRKQGARCANCAHFQGGEDAEWAPCNIFPEHRVNAGGWCKSWFEKS